ncbi:MAG: hypothetical protein JSW47_12235, partial [Phycisphaerales bacterium]
MLARHIRSMVTILSLTALFSICRGSVLTGLDRVDAHGELFRGRRVGIITNHTAYGSDGKYIVDVFHA